LAAFDMVVTADARRPIAMVCQIMDWGFNARDWSPGFICV